MVHFLLFVLVAFVDLVAIVLASTLASRLADRDIPGFLKGVIGAVCGIGGELLRVGALALAMKLFSQLAGATTGFLGFLIAFRLWNIPVLVGIAFLAGTAAGASKVVKCPICGASIQLNTAAMRQKAVDYAVSVPCSKCGGELSVGTLSWDVLSAKPASADQPSSEQRRTSGN